MAKSSYAYNEGNIVIELTPKQADKLIEILKSAYCDALTTKVVMARGK